MWIHHEKGDQHADASKDDESNLRTSAMSQSSLEHSTIHAHMCHLRLFEAGKTERVSTKFILNLIIRCSPPFD